jgi:hypothetical protein
MLAHAGMRKELGPAAAAHTGGRAARLAAFTASVRAMAAKNAVGPAMGSSSSEEHEAAPALLGQEGGVRGPGVASGSTTSAAGSVAAKAAAVANKAWAAAALQSHT